MKRIAATAIIVVFKYKKGEPSDAALDSPFSLCEK